MRSQRSERARAPRSISMPTSAARRAYDGSGRRPGVGSAPAVQQLAAAAAVNKRVLGPAAALRNASVVASPWGAAADRHGGAARADGRLLTLTQSSPSSDDAGEALHFCDSRGVHVALDALWTRRRTRSTAKSGLSDA